MNEEKFSPVSTLNTKKSLRSATSFRLNLNA